MLTGKEQHNRLKGIWDHHALGLALTVDSVGEGSVVRAQCSEGKGEREPQGVFRLKVSQPAWGKRGENLDSVQLVTRNH